jgi:DNA mismatch repair ATPase MutS
MRIADSLEDNISTFYAELRRISEIIRAVNANERVLLLLDEILRGTNSTDRHKGALALIRQLIGSKAVGVLATHDLGLALPELIGSGKLDPFYFDVQVEGDSLYFDYKLHPGTCQTLNASILMRKMGIDVDVYGDS